MNKYAHIFAALKAAAKRTGYKLDRHELISGLTNGRTTSLTDLSSAELQELHSLIQADGGAPKRADTMRKKIISLLKYQGYTLPDGKADMPRIYAFILKHGYLHIPLNKYSYEELPKLVYQVEQMKTKYIQSL